jgi:uncharacterized protein with HEPN domain
MSKRVDAITLADMLDYAQAIAERTSAISRETFVNDGTLSDAVSFLLTRLAAAAERITPAGKRADIPWDH